MNIAESGWGSLWDELVGPYFSIRDAAEYLGMTEYQVAITLSEGHLVGVPNRDDTAVILPIFQFNLEGSLEFIPHLRKVMEIYRGPWELDPCDIDAWEFASWLSTPVEDWGGRRPYEMLQSGAEDVVKVIRQARARREKVS